VRVAYCGTAAAFHIEGGTRGTGAEASDRPLWWTERDRAGFAYFQKKWALLRYVEDVRTLPEMA
jgi:hypothetical protein